MSRKKMLKSFAAAAILAGGVVAASAASATTWLVDATFDDGATLKGFFSFNQYGYISNYDLKTSAKGAFAGFEFKSGAGYIAGSVSADKTTIPFFGPTYNGPQLTLISALPLTSGLVGNSLTGGSFECQNSYSCPAGGQVRFLNVAASAITPTPEPATWTMMLFGFGLVGFGLRKRAYSRSESPHLALS
jgi:PEP-CTERM motif